MEIKRKGYEKYFAFNGEYFGKVTMKFAVFIGDEIPTRKVHEVRFRLDGSDEWVFDQHDAPMPIDGEGGYGVIELVYEEAVEWFEEEFGEEVVTPP